VRPAVGPLPQPRASALARVADRNGRRSSMACAQDTAPPLSEFVYDGSMGARPMFPSPFPPDLASADTVPRPPNPRVADGAPRLAVAVSWSNYEEGETHYP